MKGNYPTKRKLPCIPGFEGSGIIVASGGGIRPWMMVGKRVAFLAKPNSDGSWAEYAIVDVDCVMELEDHVSMKEAACSFINPLTVVAMAEEC